MRKFKFGYTFAEIFHSAGLFRKSAYTLAEVVVVMLIIAVIVAISIKITRAKLDSIVSLTYYSAFDTLRSVSEEMLKDFRNTDEYVKDTDNQDAVTLPRSADNFCELFISYVNTKINDDDSCKGNSVTDASDFNDKEPDIILRNGMKLYNVSQEAEEIADLENNDEGVKYNKNSTEIDSNKWGYTVYVDLNGNKGNGELWDDVYKYYITLSGKVIPAYNAEGDGGDSRFHLQVSVKEEVEEKWIKKNVSYKEAACSSGYINSSTPYCSTATAVLQTIKCAADGADCTLKFIMPVRF